MRLIKSLNAGLLLLGLLGCGNKPVQQEKTILTKESFVATKQDKIHEGDLILNSQKEVDNFAKAGYTFMNGSLTITDEGLNEALAIENLDGLSSLKTINGSIVISVVAELSSVTGLENLEKINGGLTISGTKKLLEINCFDKLKIVNEDIIFGGDYNLQEIASFNALETVRSVFISSGSGLKKLGGFNQIKSADKIYISNTKLKTVDNFKQLEKVNEFTIEFNENLTSVSLVALSEVNDHLAFHENDILNGDISLPKATKIKELYIWNNRNFINFCNVSEQILNGKIVSFNFANNKYNPKKEQLKNKCKL